MPEVFKIENDIVETKHTGSIVLGNKIPKTKFIKIKKKDIEAKIEVTVDPKKIYKPKTKTEDHKIIITNAPKEVSDHEFKPHSKNKGYCSICGFRKSIHKEKRIGVGQGVGGGRPLKFKTVEELEKKIDEYFKSCWSQKIDMFGNPVYLKDKKGKKTDEPVIFQNKPYTVSGLAIFLGTFRDVVIDYENGKYDDLAKSSEENKKFSNAIKKAKEAIFNYKEEFLYSGKNPTGCIFDLKNNYGWKDKTETDVTSGGKPIPILGGVTQKT